MISRIHDRLGTAGFIVAIVALIAALGGSAYAANAALSGKQKKEVEKIAKKYAGKPGTNGTNGTNGSNGAAGAKGDKGDPGTPGTNGVDGVSPKGTNFVGAKAPCTNGGVEYKGATTNLVCNGKDGEIAPDVLPSGKTEAGSWSALTGEEAFIPLTWSIRLADGLDGANVHVVNGAPTTECPGSAAEPEAAAGHLCVYVGTIAFGATPELTGPYPADATEAEVFENEEEGAATSGAFLYMRGGGAATALWGTFAVTAP